MRQQARHLGRIGWRAVWRAAGQWKAAQGQPPFVSNNLQSRADIERAKLRIGWNAQAHMAAVHVFIAHAKSLRAKQEANPLLRQILRLWGYVRRKYISKISP